MKFTPKSNTGAIISGVLIIAVALIGISHSAIWSSADHPSQVSLQIQGSSQDCDIGRAQITPALYWSPAGAARTAGPAYYQPVAHWYRSKSWWKRNAPIVGGAAGGALIGGLAGGGTGALIGGAVGGGGGYAYKRLKNHHSDHDYRYQNQNYQNHGYQNHHPGTQYHHAQ
jgi:hypothetical protein